MKPILLAAALIAALAGPAYADSGILPDPQITPGAVPTVDVGEICSHGTRELRHWDRARDDAVMAEYGLPPGRHPDYEVDHLIPLGIGGADDIRNLWPESVEVLNRNGALKPRTASNGDYTTWSARPDRCA